MAVFALSGCGWLTDTGVTQDGSLGNLSLKVSACASKANTPNCNLGNSMLAAPSNATAPSQIMLGIEIPSNDQPAASFTTTPFDTIQATFALSPTYAAQLTTLRPPPAGEKWVGYLSDPHLYTPGTTGTAFIPIARPPTPDGTPNPSTFEADIVLGARGVLDNAPASRDVTCDQPTAVNATVCIDSEQTLVDTGLHDFVFQTPAPVTVAPGQTAAIPVTGKFSGPADPNINFALSASTTLPGANATVNVPTLAPPADSTTSVTVSVPVPASATPGRYAVTLTGALGATGESVSTTGTIIIPAPPSTGSSTTTGTPSATGPSVAAGKSGLTPLKVRVSAEQGLLADAVVRRGFAVKITTNQRVRATVLLIQTRKVRSHGKLVSKPRIIVSRRVVAHAPSTTVVFRSRKLTTGKVGVKLIGASFKLRTSALLG